MELYSGFVYCGNGDITNNSMELVANKYAWFKFSDILEGEGGEEVGWGGGGGEGEGVVGKLNLDG